MILRLGLFFYLILFLVVSLCNRIWMNRFLFLKTRLTLFTFYRIQVCLRLNKKLLINLPNLYFTLIIVYHQGSNFKIDTDRWKK